MQIKIQQFEGPLDLLLQLIENQELDITVVSLATVTEQFLGYVKSLQEKNPTHLADFLVIAAKLLVIKSKALLPNLDLGVEEEETATDLAAQLLIYKKFKEVAKYFRRLEQKRKQAWTREAEFSAGGGSAFGGEVQIAFMPDQSTTPQTLANSLSKLAEQLKEIIRHPQEVIREVVSINEKIQHIQKLISEKLETSLAALLKDSKSKTEVIVTFLALLELIKQRVLVVEQNEMFGDVMIRKTES